MRNPEIPGREISAKAIPTRGTFLDPASLCGVTRCDAESRKYPPMDPASLCGVTRCLMRNPGIPGQEIRAKAIPTRGTFLDPASLCGVTHALDPASGCGVTRCDAVSRNTHHVIPRYDAVSRKYGQGEIPATGPRIVVRGDSRTGPRRLVIPHLMRNPGIPANECLAFPLWTPHRCAG